MEGLSPEQQSQLTIFREVTADTRDTRSAVQLLQSCDWNVEQAIQLHLASVDDEGAQARPAAASSSNLAGSLGAPLLANDDRAAPGVARPAAEPPLLGEPSRFSLVGWLSRGLRHLGLSFIGILRAFFFGPGGAQLGGGFASGEAFTRALTAAYGADLLLPRFFEGSFSEALQAARREAKLLVLYLHSEHARHTQTFCSEVLSNDFVRTMLDENFLVWGGDIARMEAHQVAQLVHARQYPWFCVLLPASVDEIRVIGALNGEVQVDQTSALLAACLDEMESHRAEIIARREQQVEDRQLREQQDQEYQQALEVDRKRMEEQQRMEREQREAERLAEEQRREEREERERREAELEALEARRRRRASELAAEGPESTSRLSLRLPAGQRIQRRFPPTATLADVYAWAECAAYLPENEGKGLEVPHRFMLKMSFPSKDLTEMDRSIGELQLAGTNILLAALEDDD
uniref:UBX domain-containing protein n=1 Tax=Alexandrium monilatum TaxID=311494 RepID=A0A7S4W5Z3_9DINO|mmetsp:Transcript_549/g.1900  ORF Transcript_549/g.1900 Transcript_549/m.1900 type:complete len:462 (+) Transcript_549:59-1444(+)